LLSGILQTGEEKAGRLIAHHGIKEELMPPGGEDADLYERQLLGKELVAS
jgi:hypothetical protein